MKYPGIREEAVKKKVGQDFFEKFDTTDILKNVDFAVKFRTKDGASLLGDEYLLWAEAKDGRSDIYASFVQLILTIGQSGTVGKLLPPPFLGAFDSEKIAFVPYIDIADVFTINDFNWRVTPSNHDTREFKLLYDKVYKIIEDNMYLYDFEKDETALRHFIRTNLPAGRTGGKVQITKNNFIHIYLRWLEEVKPHISFNWDEGKKGGVLDCDFYRADLFVDDKNTENIEDDTAITDKLSVVFRGGQYKIVTKVWGEDMDVAVKFHSGGRERYTAFWKKYKRPPLREYWDYIIDRRDLLVPQDIRERKGSFFTPQRWVELSQQYIADVLGTDWQDEYYVWDCCAGTGNLLVGLTNKYNVWASTLDKADVDVMHERIEGGADLLHDHVFQFDFLNDDFTKLPQGLQDIIADPDKRKKLVIYINPPYSETNNKSGGDRSGVSITSIGAKYSKELGDGKKELFAQFFARIYDQIHHCVLAEFSTLKILQAPNFQDFRQFFRARLEKIFVVPANTFDNVKGEFPIGFMVWNLGKEEVFAETVADVYDKDGHFIETKGIYAHTNTKYINDWLKQHKSTMIPQLGIMYYTSNDFQQQNTVNISSEIFKNHLTKFVISAENLIPASVYFAVRKVIPADWLNDRDQFLYPGDGWQADREFQNDCLAYTLFNNNIQSTYGPNHWIPFTEAEVGARDRFASRFMTDFIAGKERGAQSADLFSAEPQEKPAPLQFSPEASAVFATGRELWRYYHSQTGPTSNVNASLYDIREHFQGRNDKGKMNNRSTDEHYNELIGALRSELKALARKITPRVYEYGFLKQ
ncbi:MAG: hypothetical protein LBM63_03855 [Rikenellaceae bacterium]|jgi:hypothetical protein|nr:hypothetical protein [Rikenellaceae bacterium]